MKIRCLIRCVPIILSVQCFINAITKITFLYSKGLFVLSSTLKSFGEFLLYYCICFHFYLTNRVCISIALFGNYCCNYIITALNVSISLWDYGIFFYIIWRCKTSILTFHHFFFFLPLLLYNLVFFQQLCNKANISGFTHGLPQLFTN